MKSEFRLNFFITILALILFNSYSDFFFLRIVSFHLAILFLFVFHHGVKKLKGNIVVVFLISQV